MKMNKKRMLLAALLGGALALPAGNANSAEPERYTTYFEDDAWYDVSEWFDGNDYNPTDEAIGRWDNETFDYRENLTSSDQDNDVNVWEDYGYASQDNDWFYDYYDDGHRTYDDTSLTVYDDIDDDGLYDSYAYYGDLDNDGLYEDYNYYWLNPDVSETQEGQEAETSAQQRQKQMKSSPMQLSGKVQESKTVTVRDRKHSVAMVQTQQGQTVAVDLGAADKANVSKGDQLTVKGHVTKVGDKALFIAESAEMQSGTKQINRDGRQYTGTIEKTKKVDVRGDEHLLAKVNTEDGKTMMVDLGSSQQPWINVQKGQKVTVQGVPAKIKDRVLLMAQKVTKDGQTRKVARDMQMSR